MRTKSPSTYVTRILEIFHILQTIYKSDLNQQSVNLYLANGEQASSLLGDRLVFSKDYDQQISQKLVEFLQQEYVACKEGIPFEGLLKLTPKETLVHVYEKYLRVGSDTEDSMQYFNQIDTSDLNLTSFLSTIDFVDHLCNLCEFIRGTNEAGRKELLLKELCKLNRNLPSNVYIPFTSGRIRNYLVCRIPLSETRIIKTKERSPFMITVELIKIEELVYRKETKSKKKKEYILLEKEIEDPEHLREMLQRGESLINKPLTVANADKKDEIDEAIEDLTKTLSPNNSSLSQPELKTMHNLAELENMDSNDSESDEEREANLAINEGMFGESLEEKTARLRTLSPYGDFQSWTTCSLIVKNGEDLRQEQFCSQMINEFDQIFKKGKTGCWVYAYEILATGREVGLIEVVNEAMSIDNLKQKLVNETLGEFFRRFHQKDKNKRSLIVKRI